MYSFETLGCVINSNAWCRQPLEVSASRGDELSRFVLLRLLLLLLEAAPASLQEELLPVFEER